MSQSLATEENKTTMEEIINEDWPLLNELETTRFSLKNKRNTKKETTLKSIKEMSEKEDDIIAAQNISDEKLIEAFMDGKDSSNNTQNNLNNNEQRNQNQRQSMSEIEENFRNRTNNNNNNSVGYSDESYEDESTSKLVAKGLGKVYMDKTSSLLSPLKFLLLNSNKIVIGLIQFVIPAIITWLLISNVDIVKAVLSKETTHTQYLYIGIFYFACLFVSITSQVVLSGVLNVFKLIFNSLATEAKK